MFHEHVKSKQVLLGVGGVTYKRQSGRSAVVYKTIYVLSNFLPTHSVNYKRTLKSTTIIVDMSISPCSFITFVSCIVKL